MKPVISFLLICSNFFLFAQKDAELQKACMKGDLAAVKSLVESGANVNAKNEQGAPPLAAAILYPEICTYLLEKGADANGGDYPALVNAVKFYSKDVIAILLKAGADPNKPALIDLAASAKKLLADEQAKGKDGNKMLINAYQGMVDKAGPPVKRFPLMTAMETNCLDCAKMLVDAGAKTDIVNDISGNNLLHELSTHYKTPEKRKEDFNYNKPYLEKAGFVYPSWYNNLDYSKYANAEDMVTYLLSKNVDLQAKNKLGHSPLYAAFDLDSRVNSELVLSLVKHGASLNTDKGKSMTESPAIIEAAAYCSPEVVNAMLEKGTDINVEDKLYDRPLKSYCGGFTALINAIRCNNTPVALLLIEKGAKTSKGVHGISYVPVTGCASKVNNKGPIFYAIDNNNMEVIKALVESHSWYYKEDERLEINEISKKEVQDFGTITITKMSCYGYDQYSPTKYAKASGKDEIADYLKSKGIKR